jgi:uncharacterized protein (TIGR01777 family)
MRVFITGGSGYIGRAIASALLERGDQAIVLSRDAARARAALPAGVEVVEGDPTAAGVWQDSVTGCDAIINLAGEPLAAQRWDARFRQIAMDSRVDATRFLVEAIAAAAERPRVLVSASGIDVYGFDADLPLEDDEDEVDESAPRGSSFLARLCREWEEEALRAEGAGVRVVLMRTGVVVGGVGGPIERWARAFRFFAGGRLGSGRQWMSWIHLDDVVGAYLFALDADGGSYGGYREPPAAVLRGPVNLVAPGRLRNRDFARRLGRALHRPALIPAPARALRLVLGDFAEYLLHGRPAVPRALLAAGYVFRHPELEPAAFVTARTSAPAG